MNNNQNPFLTSPLNNRTHQAVHGHGRGVAGVGDVAGAGAVAATPHYTTRHLPPATPMTPYEASPRGRMGSVYTRDTTMLQRDASMLQRETTMLQRDTSVLQRDATILPRDASLLHRDTSMLQRDNLMYQRDNTMPQRDNAIYQRDNTMQNPSPLLAGGLKRLSTNRTGINPSPLRVRFAEDPAPVSPAHAQPPIQTTTSSTGIPMSGWSRPIDTGTTTATTTAATEGSSYLPCHFLGGMVQIQPPEPSPPAPTATTAATHPSSSITADSSRRETDAFGGDARSSGPATTASMGSFLETDEPSVDTRLGTGVRPVEGDKGRGPFMSIHDMTFTQFRPAVLRPTPVTTTDAHTLNNAHNNAPTTPHVEKGTTVPLLRNVEEEKMGAEAEGAIDHGVVCATTPPGPPVTTRPSTSSDTFDRSGTPFNQQKEGVWVTIHGFPAASLRHLLHDTLRTILVPTPSATPTAGTEASVNRPDGIRIYGYTLESAGSFAPSLRADGYGRDGVVHVLAVDRWHATRLCQFDHRRCDGGRAMSGMFGGLRVDLSPREVADRLSLDRDRQRAPRRRGPGQGQTPQRRDILRRPRHDDKGFVQGVWNKMMEYVVGW